MSKNFRNRFQITNTLVTGLLLVGCKTQSGQFGSTGAKARSTRQQSGTLQLASGSSSSSSAAPPAIAPVITPPTAVGNWAGVKTLGIAASQRVKAVDTRAIARDTLGNIYVSGQSNGNLEGNQQLGIEDGFITKFDSSGNKVWTKTLGVAPLGNVLVNGLAVDSDNNIIAAGYTAKGLNGNQQVGSFDIFIAKLNSAGAILWIKQHGQSSKQMLPACLKLDRSGNALIGGKHR